MRTPARAFAILLAVSRPLFAAPPSPSPADFVDVAEAIPGIVVDLAYAGTNNMFRQRFYPLNRCFLRRNTVEKLRAAQLEFAQSGLRLKVLDGYRPQSVQAQLWKAKPDARYVAPPGQGSRHNRGAAVDVTLVDKDGRELVMPTAFDDFTERAAARFSKAPAEALKNRSKLQEVMTRHGFAILDSEWWHFDDTDWQSFPLANVSIEELVAHGQYPAANPEEAVKGCVENDTPPRAPAPNKELTDLQKRLEALEERVRILESTAPKQSPP